MGTLRRHIRGFATAWLLFQVASLSALVPRDCCAAHRPVQQKKSDMACHETAAAPIAAHGGHAMHRATTPDKSDECKLRGACDGPMAGFIAQLSLQGVLGDPFQLAPSMVAGSLDEQSREHLIGRLAPPDAPPPRS